MAIFEALVVLFAIGFVLEMIDEYGILRVLGFCIALMTGIGLLLH